MNNSNKGENYAKNFGIGLFLIFFGFVFPPLFVIGIILVIGSVAKSMVSQKSNVPGKWSNSGGNSMSDYSSPKYDDELEQYNSRSAVNNKNTMSGYSDARYSASSTKYSVPVKTETKQVKTYNVEYDECELDGCSKNECPVCKTISLNGYCSNCGFKFRH